VWGGTLRLDGEFVRAEPILQTNCHELILGVLMIIPVPEGNNTDESVVRTVQIRLWKNGMFKFIDENATKWEESK
jgi:hypothetical protein